MSAIWGDVRTVFSKEMRELVFVRSREPLILAVNSLVVLFLGVVLPLVAGPHTLDQGWLLALWAWAPVFLVGMVVADLVAGERENHTLETLLASRLSERAILLGKVSAAVLYGWGLVLLAVLLSLLTINLAYAGDSLLVYTPLMAIGGGLLSLLASLLAASFGVLISVHAGSLRQAQRRTLIALLSVLLLQLLMVPALRLLPGGWTFTWATVRHAFDSVRVVGAIAVLLALAGVGMLAVAAESFQRHHLNVN